MMWFFTGMSSDMHLEMCDGREAFGTQITDIGSLARMDAAMSFDVGDTGKSFPTSFAFEWALSSVGNKVPHEL